MTCVDESGKSMLKISKRLPRLYMVPSFKRESVEIECQTIGAGGAIVILAIAVFLYKKRGT